MKKQYIITSTERYTVSASSPKEALALYQVMFNNVPPEAVNLDSSIDLIDLEFEYLDGSETVEATRVEEREYWQEQEEENK